MKLLYTDFTFTHFRFNELITKLNNGEILLNDCGYVNNIDEYLTGCLSNFPNTLNINLGNNKTYEILGILGCQRFKTLLDFTKNKIPCQGKYFKDIDGYLQYRINYLLIGCNLIFNYSENKEDIINYFKNNF